MGTLRFLYSRKFGDPVVNTGTPICLRKFMMRPTLMVWVQFSRRGNCNMSDYEVAKSGAEEIENGD